MRGAGVSGKTFDAYTKDELSRIQGMLATLLSSLTEIRSTALRNKYVAEAQISVRNATVWSAVRTQLVSEANVKGQKAPTKDDIKVEVERQMARTKLFADLHSAKYEELQSLWYSIPHILHSIDTRIRELDGDRKTSKYYGHDIDVGLEMPEVVVMPAKGEIDYTKAMETE